MKRREVTDEMVERAVATHPYSYDNPIQRLQVRRMLEEALNAPELCKGPVIATDEQVEAVRAERARMGAEMRIYTARQEARNIAQAVVNAPAKPEIPVTVEMVEAARKTPTTGMGAACAIWLSAMYRAMRRLEPKQ